MSTTMNILCRLKLGELGLEGAMTADKNIINQVVKLDMLLAKDANQIRNKENRLLASRDAVQAGINEVASNRSTAELAPPFRAQLESLNKEIPTINEQAGKLRQVLEELIALARKKSGELLGESVTKRTPKEVMNELEKLNKAREALRKNAGAHVTSEKRVQGQLDVLHKQTYEIAKNKTAIPAPLQSERQQRN